MRGYPGSSHFAENKPFRPRFGTFLGSFYTIHRVSRYVNNYQLHEEISILN